jgi:periplasmic divalent cation tolerance protein
MDSRVGGGYRLGIMKSTKRHLVVLMTAPDLKTARGIGTKAVLAGAAACANLIPKIESIYVWKDKLERGSEVLVLFKTTRAKLASLEKLVVELHPYDTPELIAVPVSAGTAKYLAWIDAGVGRKRVGSV